ncbi:hypothetical protein HYPDE_31333 [Hyphomicrobium denitrificans 1NES1]|uniref:DUF2380 domain-containing protein n=1 Tax=Hyphomicrobium denitrificans 1NES1 TaxID=670307 RepID=N0BBP2_9HYPH|nr:DUF3280 domain-containing protein [Hyphomicrobium denitrificans]AGK57941.1 hypothetical protein HYPDE_31333 [Hyphomicrobium denitrificans 1NES1]
MMQRFLFAFLAVLMVTPAAANTKAAVFPFDFHDAQQDGEMFPQNDPEDMRRLQLVADELKSLMQKDGRYQVVDLSSRAKEIEAASPFYKCDGCEAPIAKDAGADIAVTGYVDKLSSASLNLQIIVRDTATGKLTKTMSAAISGNTDDMWLRGVRYLWKNRFNAEAKEK